MAKGSTHTLATLLAGMCGTMQMPTDQAGLMWSVGALIATILQPDLDQIDHSEKRQGGYYGQYILKQTFPEIVEKVWYWYWQPYAKFFSHRSVFTHFPPIATPIRLLYGFWWAIPIYAVLPQSKIYIILSIFVCDILHWIMDFKIWTKIGLFSQ